MVNSAVLKEEYAKGRRFTYADYKAWDLAEGERYEMINGQAFAMAAPSAYHQSISGEIFRQFANYLTGKPCKVYPAPYDVRLFYEDDESDDTVVQPDISIVCDKNKRGEEGCRGAPDLVVEILSPANTAIEMQQKFRLYRESGVHEYWVIDPQNKTLHVHLLDNDKIFAKTYGEKETAPVGIFPELKIDLMPVFSE
ncbi:MAG: Uma2 family endonuclease [Treponema sp.]|nr:Uma2 family endonuclease [Treponema sp.]